MYTDMKIHIVFIFVYILFTLHFITRYEVTGKNISSESSIQLPADSGNYFSYDGRIVNGKKAKLGQFPYQVSLRRIYNLIHFCGGSIISRSYILTAGHCLFIAKQVLIQPWTILVVAGELEISLDNIHPDHKREVSSIILHREYVMDTYKNDIALLHLDEPFNFDTTLHAIPLQRFPPKVGTICEVAGWGRVIYNGSDSRDLLFVDLPILKTSTCKKIWYDLSKGQFCAGYLEGKKDACQGDSGGGLVCIGELTGIVSTGIGCAWENLPGLYTNIIYYNSWILEHIGSEYNATNSKYNTKTNSEDITNTSNLIRVINTVYKISYMIESFLKMIIINT